MANATATAAITTPLMPGVTAQQQRDRATLVLAAMLAGLATLGPFSIDTYMPSFPAMGRAFEATNLELQQTLSAYLLPFAGMMLFHGALTDSFGRRPVILVGLLLFTGASIGCALAQSLPQLLLFRALQGMCAGTGMVAGGAMIRDIYPGHQAQRVMSMVTMIFGLAPAIAPVLGGWLEVWFGWRSIFIFLALFASLLFMACYSRLAESLPLAKRQPFALRPLLLNYLQLFASLRFGLLSSAIALNFAGCFLYIASAPAVIYNLLKLSENQFAWLFVPGIAGVVVGAFLSGKLAGKVSPQRTVRYGYTIMFSAAAFNFAYHVIFPPALPWTVAPVMIYAIGMALTMPSVTLLALDLFPDNRGLAASLQSAQQSFFSGVAAGLLSPFLSANALGLAGGMAALVATGCACWYTYTRITPGGVRP